LRESTTLTAVTVLVALSLVPAILIYWLFGTLSSADVTWASENVKLGGPVAAFFAILLCLFVFYSRLVQIKPPHEDRLARPFVGRWLATSHANVSKRVATSIVDALLTDNGMLILSGNLKNEDGKEIGNWETNEVFCTPTGLAYRYVMTDRVPTADNTSMAFCTLRIDARDKRNRPTRLSGIWDVIGSRHHDGTVELVRIDE
jgi:hypothetical protein